MIYNAVLDVQFSEELATEPVTQTEVATYLKLGNDNDIALAMLMAKRSRQICEKYANISIMYRKVKSLVHNQQGAILLPYAPYISGLVVKDLDGNILESKLTPSSFANLLSPCLPYLTLEYYAGYAFDNGTNVNYPQWAKQAILQQLAFMWGNRGDDSFGIDNMAKMTLEPYKRIF